MSCQECGAEEVESLSPRTMYACGSSDYDQQQGTFHKGSKCPYGLVLVNEKEKSDWMNERMSKGYTFRYHKNNDGVNRSISCIETKETFTFKEMQND